MSRGKITPPGANASGSPWSSQQGGKCVLLKSGLHCECPTVVAHLLSQKSRRVSGRASEEPEAREGAGEEGPPKGGTPTTALSGLLSQANR